VENLASAVLAKPQNGKALLQAVVEGILMEPSPDGYGVRVALKKTNPAALGEDSGVGDSQSGCGGLHSGYSSTSRPVFTQRILLTHAPSASHPSSARR
jgi:hypothetical protein